MSKHSIGGTVELTGEGAKLLQRLLDSKELVSKMTLSFGLMGREAVRAAAEFERLAVLTDAIAPLLYVHPDDELALLRHEYDALWLMIVLWGALAYAISGL
jgi:hypothetical protein